MTPEQLFVAPVQPTESDERYTPSWVFDGLGIEFDLDPCAPIDGGDCVPARCRYTAEVDGLTQPWFGVVWCNPPFSSATAWGDRFREHGNGVFLGPWANARWAVDLVAAAELVWFARDFPFTHPTHAGRRSSMPILFAAMGDGAPALRRLATSGLHPGVLLAPASVEVGA